MRKKLFFTLLAFCLIFPKISQGKENNQGVDPCQTAWNDKMQEYDEEYVQGLNNLLFQKKKTSVILDSGAVSYNLRSHNCKMYQICEVVNKSLYPDENSSTNQTVTGKVLRCQPTEISEFGGVFEACSSTNLQDQASTTVQLWSKCVEQAEERIDKVEAITETELAKSIAAKKTGNLVGYLMQLNEKLDKLAMDVGGMIGLLFDVTRKMTCVLPQG